MCCCWTYSLRFLRKEITWPTRSPSEVFVATELVNWLNSWWETRITIERTQHLQSMPTNLLKSCWVIKTRNSTSTMKKMKKQNLLKSRRLGCFGLGCCSCGRLGCGLRLTRSWDFGMRMMTTIIIIIMTIIMTIIIIIIMVSNTSASALAMTWVWTQILKFCEVL